MTLIAREAQPIATPPRPGMKRLPASATHELTRRGANFDEARVSALLYPTTRRRVQATPRRRALAWSERIDAQTA